MNREPAARFETDLSIGERGVIRDRIVGAWELVEYSMISTEGDIHHPLGPDARGLILYTADGFMSAQLMNPDRPRFRSRRVHGGEPHELSAAAAGYLAYSGPYRIDEAQSVVYHGMSVALFPNWVGEEGARWVRFDGDRMTPTARQQVFDNRTWKPVVVWRRAEVPVAPEA
ncbi:hypothetical protein BN975_01762 [Mycolicibacterium farcinogenes]|uniref:Lipocalin-like domain-containing protein n=1 Tax=Mycolicibacterium senegalense TaxID=1796 RepID=A0A378W4A5_9MYCO|nr:MULTISPECIES: lipocalin-like domain-containing protein [Mycolicibacterium]CDP84742.1 hypothetical protein BN975_01762 [Mycolicibacterium farcinogenes]SUA27414.1 Uncharacterised protein [Mycolicibacterium senegalense]